MQRRSYFAIYPVLFLYVVSFLLASVAEWAIVLKVYSMSADAYIAYYWTNEFALQTLLFLVMLSFIYRAWEGVPRRLETCAGVAILVVLGTVGSVLGSAADAPMKVWLTQLSRNLSFASALLNFLLWAALIKNRSRDSQLLLLSAGLGVVTTGKAVGHSLRALSRETQTLGNTTIVLTQLLCLAVWWWSLRSVPARDRAGKKVVPITPAPGASA
jgi:hypothetical protein